MRIGDLIVVLVLSFVVIVSSLLLEAEDSVAFGVDHRGDAYTVLVSEVGANAIASCIIINEVMYNPLQSGTDSAYEWLELYNTCNKTFEVAGWGIRDNGGYDAIPPINISGYGFVVVAATDNFSVNFPDYLGAIVFLGDGRIGNGLGNEGDHLILTDEGGNVIDELSYGSDTTVNSSWMKKVAEGHSMERQPAGGAFVDNTNPTPGFGLMPSASPTPEPTPSIIPLPTSTPVLTSTPTPEPTPTPTSSEPISSPTPLPAPEVSPTPSVMPTTMPTPELTSTPIPTATPSAVPTPTIAPTQTPMPSATAAPIMSPTLTVIPAGTIAHEGDMVLNEIMYDPKATLDTDHEWIELYNVCNKAIEISGWSISDNSSADMIPAVTVGPSGFMVIAAKASFFDDYPGFDGSVVFINGSIGSGFNNDGDRITLRDSAGNVIDELSYGKDESVMSLSDVDEGCSLERQPAGGDFFINNSGPTPGRGLPPSAPVSTPTVAPSPTLGFTATPTPTVSATPVNVSAGTVANRGAVLINEVQNNPPQSGSDSSYEWIELYNPGAEPVELVGWGISDNNETDELPSLNLSVGGFAVVAASGNFSDNFQNYNGTVVFIADGRIGNGLGNAGDRLILKDSVGTPIDDMSYGDDESITSPSYPKVAEGHSLERVPCGGHFVDNEVPTPGSCLLSRNTTPSPTPAPPPTSMLVSTLMEGVPELDSSDSISVTSLHLVSSYHPARSMAYISSSVDRTVDLPGMSLKSLLITLSSALAVVLGCTVYRRKAR